jgi:hypothetical protein
MSHALSDLLADRFDHEPPEITTIKKFVNDNFTGAVAVAIRDQQIIISTPSAALAGALRPRLFELKKLCATDKRLVIRIGK